MAALNALSDITLTPIPGKKYFSTTREWREEFIYFLLVDRFHDGLPRTPATTASRSKGISTPDDFYGGKIKGITQHLITSRDWDARQSGCHRCSRIIQGLITVTTSITI